MLLRHAMPLPLVSALTAQPMATAPGLVREIDSRFSLWRGETRFTRVRFETTDDE